MKKTIYSILAIILIISIVSCKSSKDTIDLKFNMPTGSKYEYAMTMAMNMTQNFQGQEMKMTNKMGFVYLFETLKDSANWKVMQSTITGVKIDMNGGGMTMSYDSDKPNTDTSGVNMVGMMYGKMKGQKFTFTLNDKGEVGSVSGFEEMFENMFANMPNKEMMKAQMKAGFNEESFKQNMQQSFAAYPGKPVKVGESWTKNMTMNTQGQNMNSINTYTLEAVNGNDAKVKVEAKLSMPESQVNGVTMSMTGTMNGNLVFDIPTGLTMDGKMDMKMNMEVTSAGQKMPMQNDMNVTITGKKIK